MQLCGYVGCQRPAFYWEMKSCFDEVTHGANLIIDETHKEYKGVIRIINDQMNLSLCFHAIKKN